MFHLLPEKEKKVLKKEYILRLIFVILCFILVTIIVASVFLFPSYILAKRKLADISDRNNQIKKEIQHSTDPSLTNFLASLKSNLASLMLKQNTLAANAYIKEITDQKGSGISLIQFNITSGDPETIIISGNSDTRDHLVQFYRNLQGLKDFSKADLPISDFAKDKNINFTITLTVKNHV